MTEPTMTGGAPAAGVPGELAGYGDRFLAFLIDFGVLILIGLAFGILQWLLTKLHLGFLGAILGLVHFVVNIGYFIYLWGVDNPVTGRGQTVGKMVMNIKIIKADGTDVGVGDSILRYIGYIVSSVIILLGYVWIFIDDKNQGWHDKIAKTYVIKT